MNLQNFACFSPLDISLAEMIARLDGTPRAEPLGFITALLAHATFTQRHICIRISELRTPSIFFDELPDDEKSSLDTYAQSIDFDNVLRETPCIGKDKPIVLEADRLYIQRYWFYEEKLKSILLAYLAEPAKIPPSLDEIRRLHAYFDDPDNEQIHAVQNLFRHRFTVICGGPGTGKTTIIATMLAQWFAMHPESAPAVCAPTGKAQARLAESLSDETQKLRVSDEIKSQILAIETSTIHRLLQPLRHEGGTLDNELLIVDEVSMVPLDLLTRLLAAAPNARIVLLGDKDQLDAVENGTVLSDLDVARRDDPRWAERMTLLQVSRRFKAGGDIERFKNAVNAGDTAAARIHCENPGAELAFRAYTPNTDPIVFLRTAILDEPAFHNGPWLKRHAEISDAFNAMEAFKILCAQRHGIFGVEKLNLLIRRILRRDEKYFDGLPVMILENNYNLRLFNGDIGICRDNNGTMEVCFRMPDGGFRAFHPALLPHHTDAFAMTIHKSQGSGFDHILMILPGGTSKMLTRELLYTGITRAKSHATICAARYSIETAIRTTSIRHSALPEKLVEKL